MLERATSNTLLAKAIRIALTFALVFWASFKVETLAFADIVTDDGGKHEAGTLNDMAVWNATGSLGDKGIEGDKLGTAGGKGGKTVEMQVGDQLTFVAEAIWADGKPENTYIADFVNWESSDGCVSLSASKGLVTVKAESAGTATVTCSPEKGKADLVSKSFAGKSFEVSLTVHVAERESQKQPTIANVEIIGADGNVIDPNRTIELSAQDRDAYAFKGAVAHVKDALTNEDMGSYSSLDGSLATLSEGVLSEPEWEVVDADDSVADIDPDGTLHMHADGEVKVRCTVRSGEVFASADVTVVSKAEADKSSGSATTPADAEQGKSDPQPTLRIVSDIAPKTPVPGTDDETGAENEGAGGEGDNEASEGAVEPTAEKDGPESGSPDGDAAEVPGIDVTYTPEQLLALGSDKRNYSMCGPGGWVIVQGEGPTLAAVLADAGFASETDIESVTFQGSAGETTVAWSDLMGKRSYFPRGPEGDLSDGVEVAPMVAVNSYVYPAHASRDAQETEGEGGAADASGNGGEKSGEPDAQPQADDASSSNAGASTASAELVPNTRFRVLVGATDTLDTGIDPDMLRWVNTIRVNGKKGEPEPEQDPDLRVRVSYAPAPIGAQPAVLSAVPNNAVGDARFGFRWQTRAGANDEWADVTEYGTAQTLRVPMAEEAIGHQYRVIMETDLVNDAGEYRQAVSDPVTIVEGFSVQLIYDPPYAGDNAVFQTNVIFSAGVDAGSVKYTWQESEDGGDTWVTIPGRTDPQLVVPTNPITEDAGDGSGEPANIIYIRVKATVSTEDGEQEATSNVMPLTVQTGSKSDGGSGSRTEPADDATVPGSDDNPSANQPGTPGSSQPRRPHQTTPPREVVVTPGTSQSTPGDEPAAPRSAPSEVIVDPDMADRITEQVEAEQARVESTTPGARWTEISTIGSSDDVKHVLADNPFAPFAMPLGLGIMAAGGLERILAFRREL